jgi:CheY-like chemotaxis protein
VSRILVADDNSNIQKMVALALKDEGIDVVAVGNGDAAMRKIPDLRPDLVLADIFMPVRNGYELCEFIKSDSRYMSTPVVLLVGAFDPLDEQETQRVRADGVLKKPFVPPDPLINMVKALLAKSNGQKPVPMAAPTPVAAPPKPQAAQQVASPAPVPVTASAPPVSSTQVHAEALGQLQHQQPAAPELRPPVIESQAAKTNDSDEVVTASRDPNLGEPFWAAPAETEETEETEAKAETDPKDIIDMHSFGKDEPALEPERESVFRPESPIFDIGDSADDLGKTMVSQNQAASPSQSTPSQALTGSEYELDADAAPQSTEQAPPPVPAVDAPAEIFKFDPTLTFAAPDSSEPPASENAGNISLTEVTEALPEPPVRAEKPLDAHERLEPIELDLPSLPNHDAVITAATEAARLAFSELNTLPGSDVTPETSAPRASEAKRNDSTPAFGQAIPPSSSPTPEMIEAVVNRLLERMQPQIMEVVNREVLRPAIEAIVRREMKKS